MSQDQKLYLVTGANGFIASAVTKQLVENGAHVRATVRRASAGEQLRASLSPSAQGTLEVAIVEDITAPGAFVKALEGVTNVFHMASPLPGDGRTDAKKDFLDPARAGTLNLLQVASKTTSVKKVVLTSSVASILNTQLADQGKVFTEEDWNPVTYDIAIALSGKLATVSSVGEYMQLAMVIYAASKKVAEEAAWKFMDTHKPHFVLTAVNPALVIGRPSMGGMSGTNASLFQLLVTRPVGPENTMVGYVDLRDVVQGHIEAMSRKEADGGRFLLVGGQPLNSELINWAMECSPELDVEKVQVPADAEEKKARISRFDTTRSQQILGIKYKSMEEMVKDFMEWANEASKL